MKPESMSLKSLLVLATALGLLALVIPQALAQTFEVIHTFTGGSDGANPLSGFTPDSLGNLYGTASAGGTFGIGVVFKMSASGQETVLHNFKGGTDGADPQARLLIDAAGNLYGTTYSGGASNAGTVFEVTRTGNEKVLYSFGGRADGGSPQAGLAIDKTGNLYGTTTAGGSYGNGTVFMLAVSGATWTEKVLHSFGTGTDGTIPIAGVSLDASGNLYGTTSAGGTYGYGTVFQLKPTISGWKETVLHDFALGTDGGTPYAGIVVGGKGVFYGAAWEGGGGRTSGGGTVFELTQGSSGWTFTVVYALYGWNISGSFRNLLMESGKIYATTHCDGAYSDGTVYELNLAKGVWTYTSLYEFTGGTDGRFSYSNLVSDKSGNLYGTTYAGGSHGAGVVFKVTP